MAGNNREILSVSELNRSAKRLLESEFPMIHVEGEISNLARPGSGHWYFTLKDEKAQIRCAMFKNRNHMVRFAPENGQQIIVRGRISLYEGRGEFQMIAELLEDAGDGALRRAYDKLKSTLQAEGLFDPAHKKPIPPVPNHIGIITSPTGAAIRDVIAVMRRRFPSVRISILPVQVQGAESPPQIVRALDLANRLKNDPFDVILLTRGGGSLEDLWSFNTEPVARAIDASHIPVVSAVGHESDVTIADFVADLRAPTPSAAAELITPDARVWESTYVSLGHQLLQKMAAHILSNRTQLGHLTARLQHPERYLDTLNQRLDQASHRLSTQMNHQLKGYDFGALANRLGRAVNARMNAQRARLAQQKLNSPKATIASNRGSLTRLEEKLTQHESTMRQAKVARLSNVAAKLGALNPLATLDRGYSIVSRQQDDHVITDSHEVARGDKIRARLKSGEIIAEVIESNLS